MKKLDAIVVRGETTGKRLSDENYSNKLINALMDSNALSGNFGSALSLINPMNLLRETENRQCRMCTSTKSVEQNDGGGDELN